MKKILLGMMSLLLAMSVMAERVTQEDAAIVANNFMNAAPSASSVKKAPAKRMVLKAAAQQPEDAQYYVYENADGEGWVMVAANDIVRPILAYSNTGSFRTDNMPTNVKGWLKKYDKFISKLEQEGVSAGKETAEEWKAVRKGARRVTQATAVVGPLITTQWDQDEPYNLLCPGTGTWGKTSTKAATGCVATAMAQVMNYWQWPVKGTGSHTYTPKDPNSNTGAQSKRYGQQTANFGATTYDWANMKKKHYTSDTEAQKTAISTLMYHCGVATEMMYGNYADGGSGTYTVNYGDWTDYECAQTAFYAFFGYKKPTGYMRDGYTYKGTKYYDSWTDAAWTNMIKGELDKKHPIMYAGASSEGGHSFVCDGYDSSDYFHFNWGWSGDCDGYFLLSKLNPGGDGIGGGGYDFSEQQDVIIGIEPNVTGHTVVVNGTGCTITPSAQVAENNKQLTATITPTDETYDFTSLTVKLGSTTLTKNTHYTLSSDNKTLTIKASAITGDAGNNLTITAVWTKNRYKYELLGENCAPEMDEGMLAKNAALNLTITPNSGYTLADASCWDVEMGGVALTYGTGFTYNANTGAFAIAQVTGDVAILAYGGKAVTWLANGEQFARNIALSDKLTLPANEPEACDGKVFVGWTATADYESASVAPAFVKTGDAASQTIFYAVFATQGEGGASVTNTYTFTSNKWEESTNTWTGTSNGNQYNDANQGVQVTTGSTGAGAKTTQSFNNVTKVVVKYCTNASKGAGSIDVTIGSTKVSHDVTSTGGTILRNLEFAFSNVSGTATLKVNCTTNSIYVNSIAITTGGGASYSDYTTSCTPAEPCVLTGITLNTDGVKKAFKTGEAFSYAGLVVTAAYSNCNNKVVTPTSVSSPNMSVAGTKVVTVSYTENEVTKTATYQITVTDPTKYTVRFYSNGALVGDAQTVVEGLPAVKPANPTACEGYTFAGWVSAVMADDVTDEPAYVDDFTATKDQDYHAVYSYVEESEGSGSTGERTFTFSEIASANSWANSQAYTNIEIAPVTVVANGGGNNGKWYTSGSGSWRMYSGGTVVITAENGSVTAVSSSPSCSWTISNGEATFSPSARTDFTEIIVSYTTGSGASSTTYYTTSPDCTPCTSTVSVNKGTAAHGSFSLDYAGELNTCGGAVTVTVTATPAEGCRFKEITQTGVEDVTINQEAKTVTYAKKSEGTSTINVVFVEKDQYTVEFIANGASLSTQTLYEGTAAVAPNNVEAPCEDYTFAGWWTETLPEDNTEAKSWINNFTVNKDQTYYAVFSKIEEGEGSKDVTFTAGTDISDGLTITKDGVTITLTSGTLNRDDNYRCYANNSMTVSVTSTTITKIVMNCNASGTSKGGPGCFTANGYSYSGQVGTWTGNAASITFSAGSQVQINSMIVTTGGGASSTTYYTTTTHCGPTAVEEVNSEWTRDACRKVLHNGQIYLLYQGTIYDVQGRRVKEL